MADKEPKISLVRIEDIDLDFIGYDTSYDAAFPGSGYDDLRAAIGRWGVTNPIRVKEGRDAFLLVSGRRRVLAARDLGIRELPAHVYDVGLADADALRINLLDNFPSRKYSAVEAAWAVKRLSSDFSIPMDMVIDDFFPLLHLDHSLKIGKNLVTIWGLEDEIKALSHRRGYSLSSLACWASFTPEDRGAILAVFSSLPITSGGAGEILNLLSEISRRDGADVFSIFGGEEIGGLLSSDAAPPSQKAEKLKAAIRKARRPRLSELERKFADAVVAVRLPRGARLEHSPYFEGEEFTVSFQFRDKRDIRAMGEYLVALSEAEELSGLLSLL